LEKRKKKPPTTNHLLSTSTRQLIGRRYSDAFKNTMEKQVWLPDGFAHTLPKAREHRPHASV